MNKDCVENFSYTLLRGKIMKLKEIVRICYGKNQNCVESKDGLIPIYGTSGVIGRAIRPLSSGPSVLLGRKGSINNTQYSSGPFWTIDTLFYTKINTSIVIPQYLFYYLSTLDLNKCNEGTGVPSVTADRLYDLDIKVPSFCIQKHIVDIIGSIDEKIQ